MLQKTSKRLSITLTKTTQLERNDERREGRKAHRMTTFPFWVHK